MQTKFITLLLVLSAFTFQAQIKTPAPSPSSKVEQAIGLTDVSVDYSRPAMRGRTIFGDLVPYGKVWRTGANMRTKFTTSTDITVDGQELKKGTYAILTIPNKDSWEVVMARCQECGKSPMFGNNRPWSKKATRRRWNVNVQKVKVMDNGQYVSKRLCTRCIKTLSKA